MSFAKTLQRTETNPKYSRLVVEDRITPDNVLTEFGKTVKHGRGLSFTLSASEYCDDGCTAKGNGCYAESLEGLYPETAAKLLRHSLWLFTVIRMAIIRIGSIRRLDWFRFCVDGGLPMAEHFASAKQWRQWRKAFRGLAAAAVERVGARRVHLPTESLRKARAYRAIVRGLGIVVRRTCQSESSALRSTDHRAVRVGISPRPCHAEENKELAKAFAERIRSRGQTAVVCPAVLADSKCGKCTACASPAVDVVVYPLHS